MQAVFGGFVATGRTDSCQITEQGRRPGTLFSSSSQDYTLPQAFRSPFSNPEPTLKAVAPPSVCLSPGSLSAPSHCPVVWPQPFPGAESDLGFQQGAAGVRLWGWRPPSWLAQGERLLRQATNQGQSRVGPEDERESRAVKPGNPGI